MQEKINHPNHYIGKIEVIEYLKDKLTKEQLQGFYTGNILKYISRYQKKNGIEDLKKANVYLNWLIELLSEEKESVE